MARVYNFSAGPSMLPEAVLKTAQAELLDYHGSGMSVMEMSHRSKWFDEIITNTEAAMRRVLNILCGVGAEFSAGKVTSLIGPNGVGKTTLLKCLAGLLLPSIGTVWVKGRDMRQIKPRELARMQAYVPQNGSVLFPMTVYEFVCLGRRPYVEWSISAHDKEIIEELLQYMGIASMREKFMDELSGGERQRVMLARALVQQPDILLLDEPTSALDIRHQLEVMGLIRRIAVEKHCAVILVMHDLTLVSRYSDRVVLMKDGKVWADGAPGQTITVENLRAVYGIESTLFQTEQGLVILPLHSVGGA